MASYMLTGATGFIGAYTTRLLLEKGANLTLLVRQTSDVNMLRNVVGAELARAELRITSLDEFDSLVAEMRQSRPDVVVHLAADVRARAPEQDFDAMRALHVNATENLARAALRNGARLVSLSTSDVYGTLPSPHAASGEVAPRTPYARTKAMADALLLGQYRAQGLGVVVLRPYTVYGPGQPSRQFIPGLIAACLAGRSFPMTDGMQKRDFVYVSDVARAIVLATSTTHADGFAVDICSGSPRRVADVAQLITSRIQPPTGGPVLGAVARTENEPDEHFGNLGPARSLLGWAPEVTLEDGLDATIAACMELDVGA